MEGLGSEQRTHRFRPNPFPPALLRNPSDRPATAQAHLEEPDRTAQQAKLSTFENYRIRWRQQLGQYVCLALVHPPPSSYRTLPSSRSPAPQRRVWRGVQVDVQAAEGAGRRKNHRLDAAHLCWQGARAHARRNPHHGARQPRTCALAHRERVGQRERVGIEDGWAGLTGGEDGWRGRVEHTGRTGGPNPPLRPRPLTRPVAVARKPVLSPSPANPPCPLTRNRPHPQTRPLALNRKPARWPLPANPSPSTRKPTLSPSPAIALTRKPAPAPSPGIVGPRAAQHHPAARRDRAGQQDVHVHGLVRGIPFSQPDPRTQPKASTRHDASYSQPCTVS